MTSCSHPLEAAIVRFAAIGDYGVDTADELSVANLIKTNMRPDFVVTTGDNNYLGADQIDRAIGKYYHSYIGNYSGTYGAGAVSNRFWPVLANHDYYADGYASYLQYFALPGNERYYDFQRGPVHLFMVNSETHEPDGVTSSSVQARWLSNRLDASTAPWKVVVIHDPAYSSTESIMASRWPFTSWGADAVLSGDSHNYERLEANGIPHFVNGLGGAAISGFGTTIPESRFRYSADNGAMLMTATETNMTFEFWSVAGGGTIVDRLTVIKPKLSIARWDASRDRLAWTTNAAGYRLLSATSLTASATWSAVSGTPVVEGRYYVMYPSRSGPARYYCLKRQ